MTIRTVKPCEMEECRHYRLISIDTSRATLGDIIQKWGDYRVISQRCCYCRSFGGLTLQTGRDDDGL